MPATAPTLSRPHPVLMVVSVAVSAYFALWACAPAATMRAPIPMSAEDPNEIALGFAATTGPEPALTSFANNHGLDAQAWYLHRFGTHAQVGGTLFAGQTGLLGAGVLGRFPLRTTDKFTFGVDVEGGLLWVATGVPMAWNLGGNTWIYTEPSVGWRFDNTFRLPVGIGFQPVEHLVINPELYVAYDLIGIYVKQNLTYGGAFSVGTRF